MSTKARRKAPQGAAEGPVVFQGFRQALYLPVSFLLLERSTEVAKSTLIAHCGARIVSRPELDQVDAPSPTKTWFPVRHSDVLEAVSRTLVGAGFLVRANQIALTRENARMFATMDLTTPLAVGVTLAVGVRNSIDKSLPLGFCAGSRVFVCDNLSFRSELMVHRKHTRFGQDRFEEEIGQAVQSLEQFRAAETARIAHMREAPITDEAAESLILRAYERGIVSHRLLPQVIREWREPRFEEFRPRTRWAIYNAFTSSLAPRQKTNPQHFAALTIRLGGLMGGDGAALSPPPVAPDGPPSPN
jgi:hypothetical protein